MRQLVALLLAGLASACATPGAVPRPFPGAPEPPGAAAAPEPTPPVEPPASPGDPAASIPSATFDAAAVVDTALSLRGVPYRNGGSDPSGFDCSGLVQYVFAQYGITLPREAREQVRFGEPVRLAGIEPGDLIFFATSSKEASHVGVAIGGDEFVHAPSSRGAVRIDRFSAPYWANRIVGIRRLRN
jgi:cell wall-associated NlpC family hydrolase